LGPFLPALEVPADGAMEDGRAARSELGTAEEISFDLLLVPEHPERPADLVEQLGRVPGLALGRVVEGAVTCHDRLQVAAGGERADLGEDRGDVHQPVPLPCRAAERARPGGPTPVGRYPGARARRVGRTGVI